MKLMVDGGKRTVPPIVAWAVVDFYDTGRVWSGTLDKNFTSNQAEYYALINALKIAISEGEKILLVQTDSELMARHVNGEYKCRDAKLIPLLAQVKELASNFEDFLVFHVKREQNELADLAVNVAMDDYIQMQKIADNFPRLI